MMKDRGISVHVEIISDMMEWIENNLQENIKIEDVTRVSGYSQWHFQKIFRSVTGYRLAEYIRTARILKVSEALAHSSYKITHIAFDYGFPTQQLLTRMFRKYFNCTPSQFRRAIKENPELFDVVKAQVKSGQVFNLEDCW